jgi:hypothetical protein
MPDVSSSLRTLLGSPRRRIVLALISLVILQASVCFPAASGLPGVGNYDTAYYYAVARNLADGRGSIDTVLWHFLGPPETVVRPIGDYWPPGWPFLLAALMRVFGHSMTAAIGICATLSLLLPVLVFWLAYLVRRQTWLAWLAGALVIFQNSLHQTNVTPDVSLPYALVTLLGLCAFMEHRRRRAPDTWLILVGAAMTLPFWMRGEGFIPFGAITLTVLLSGDITWRRRAVRIGWLLLGSACCQLPLWLYNLFAFGAMTPEPRTMVLFFTDIPTDLYTFGSNPSFATWWGQGLPTILDNIGDRLYENAFAFFKQNPWALGGLAVVGMIRKVDGEPRFTTTLPLTMFVVLSWLVPAVLVPNGASADRLILNTTPIQCILAVLAFDGLVRGRYRPPVLLLLGTVFLFACTVVSWPLRLENPLDLKWQSRFGPIPAHLLPAGRPALGPDDLVLTRDPWQVAALLDVRAVMVPFDGPQAMRDVIDHYRPRYLLARRGSWVDRNRVSLGSLAHRPVAQAGDAVWYELLYVD